MSLVGLKELIIQSLLDLKALDPLVLDVSELTDITDIMVIVSGTSSRHVTAIASTVCLRAKEQGIKPLGVEGETSGDWIIVDFGDLVVHVMLSVAREFYSLEGLWTNQDKRCAKD